MNIYVLDALVFGYKFTRHQWAYLCSIWSIRHLFIVLKNNIYEFGDYVIVGHAIIMNTDESDSIAYDLQTINNKLLEEKKEIDDMTAKVLKIIENFPSEKPVPQIYYIHLATT